VKCGINNLYCFIYLNNWFSRSKFMGFRIRKDSMLFHRFEKWKVHFLLESLLTFSTAKKNNKAATTRGKNYVLLNSWSTSNKNRTEENMFKSKLLSFWNRSKLKLWIWIYLLFWFLRDIQCILVCYCGKMSINGIYFYFERLNSSSKSMPS